MPSLGRVAGPRRKSKKIERKHRQMQLGRQSSEVEDQIKEKPDVSNAPLFRRPADEKSGLRGGFGKATN